MNPYLKNDVFMNYSFEDIGKSFISHLKGALKLNGFTISDHTMLPVGQDAHSELLKAIEESEIYVVVFSLDYAASRRCLDELVHVMDSFQKLDKRKFLPVFFKVEPSHVRSQQGPFMEPFQVHKTSVDPERVQRWRQALKDAGQLSGLTLQNGDEAKFVFEIVEQLEKMQRPQELHVTDHPIGVGSRAEELISKLRLDWKDIVLVVAVFGMSGIGKTTIVKEAFNRIAHRFDLSCFLADIHYMCQVPNWKIELPKALISCLTRESRFSIMSNHNDGITKIRRLVSRCKVLLVLDDIDSFQQLESLGISLECFYEGSRIIVTTRDKSSLGSIPYASYHTRLLNRRESLNLFTRLMFVRDDLVDTVFMEEVVAHAGGHPLVLKVWSCHFKQYEKEQWPSILETLKEIPHGDVQKQLRMSYDSLSNRAKKLFLDIACFFNEYERYDKDLVVKVLQDEDSRFFPNYEIQYLVDKSLLEIRKHNKMWMHRAIMEMGQEVVRQENEEEPGQRTRLWDKRDVMRVSTLGSGTTSVESISVSFHLSHEVTTNSFRKMSNLRLIFLWGDDYSHRNFCHDETTHLSLKKLKYMSWGNFPFKSFDTIDMCNVVVLRIRSSNLKTLWEGIKSLKNLKILDVCDSYSLTNTGSFSGIENLEELYFQDCRNLKELHGSIGSLQKLAILDLTTSIPLKSIPWEMIGKLASLQQLFLGNRSTLMELKYPSLYHTKILEVVDDPLWCSLKECPVTTLKFYRCNISSGVVSLPLLTRLSLHDTNFSSHPDILLQLHKLNTFELYECNTIKSVPNLPRNITSIITIECKSLVNLPCNISELKSLTLIQFESCPKLGIEDPDCLMKVTELTNLTHLRMLHCSISKVTSEIGNLVSLKELDLSGNTFLSIPDTLSNLSQLDILKINGCRQLKLLPLLPSTLKHILAHSCDSLNVMSSASVRTKVCKGSPLSESFMIHHLSKKKEVPEWCNYQSNGDVLSFVAPVHHNTICGFFLWANNIFHSNDLLKMYNKTKNTRHRFKTALGDMCIISYPLNDTTLVMEPGDSIVLKFPQGSISICGLRLIYESDVVDGKLVV